MVSRLREIVKKVAEQNELTILGYKMDDLAMVEKHLDASGDIGAAMSELDKMFGYKWDKYYPEIEKQLERRK